MTRTLVMSFLNEEGKKGSIRISNAKDGLTEEEVKASMQVILTNNIFQYNGFDLKTIDSAHIIENQTTELNVK
jgi:hypothetical protein